jgi:hypothetical protein
MKLSPLKFTLATFAFALSCVAQSADVQDQPSAAAPYKVSESTPIDRLIQKIYANSPLNTVLLRKALVDANPKVITGNPQQRVKAGTTLVVPDHAELVRTTLTPFAAQEVQDGLPIARDTSIRKQWVRFP